MLTRKIAPFFAALSTVFVCVGCGPKNKDRVPLTENPQHTVDEVPIEEDPAQTAENDQNPVLELPHTVSLGDWSFKYPNPQLNFVTLRDEVDFKIADDVEGFEITLESGEKIKFMTYSRVDDCLKLEGMNKSEIYEMRFIESQVKDSVYFLRSKDVDLVRIFSFNSFYYSPNSSKKECFNLQFVSSGSRTPEEFDKEENLKAILLAISKSVYLR